MTDTFIEKQLRVTFILSNGAQFPGAGNTLVLVGLRTSVDIEGSGMPAFPFAEVRIWGVRQAYMNALIALSFQTLSLQRNSVIVEANSGNGWSTVFAGQIITAGPDYAAFPDVSLHITARMLAFDSVNPATPTSFPGAADISTVVSTIAAKMGCAFVNNGVSGVTLQSPYFDGVAPDQLRAACSAANIDCYQEGVSQANNLTTTVIISPRGAPRTALPVFGLSKATGLVGYPVRDSRGYIAVRASFNPSFRQGAQIDLTNSGAPNVPGSDYLNANGSWLIGTLSHRLEAVKPGGGWFSDMLCYPVGQPPVIS